MAAVTVAGLEALALRRRLTSKQLLALDLLAAAPLGLAMPELSAHGAAADVIARLAARGLVSLRRDRLDRDPFDSSDAAPSNPDRRLTPEQAAALERLVRLAGERAFRVALLHGVTGSGKTEIYIRLSDAVRDAGGTYHSWQVSKVKVAVDDPVRAHVDLFPKYTDEDIHNLMAYLQTLR